MPASTKERVKRFYEAHPEKLTEKIMCPDCGLFYGYSHKSAHLKTKLHILITEAKNAQVIRVEKV